MVQYMPANLRVRCAGTYHWILLLLLLLHLLPLP
jgi:hypothetical protein